MRTAGATHVVPVGHHVPPGSVGPALPNTEFKVVDAFTGKELDATDLEAGGMGELWCRGPQAMTGYWNNPEATEEARDADGFIRTGDAVTVGNVAIVDRVSDLILYRDHQLSPAELEALLLAHPEIADAAVIGVPGEGGSVPKALVVPHEDGNRMTESALIEYIAERVPEHKRIRAVEFMDVLPRTAVGKILRRELRARERQKSAKS